MTGRDFCDCRSMAVNSDVAHCGSAWNEICETSCHTTGGGGLCRLYERLIGCVSGQSYWGQWCTCVAEMAVLSTVFDKRDAIVRNINVGRPLCLRRRSRQMNRQKHAHRHAPDARARFIIRRLRCRRRRHNRFFFRSFGASFSLFSVYFFFRPFQDPKTKRL